MTTLRRIGLTLAWVATAIALLYALENWRARRAWNQYQQTFATRGLQPELSAYVPPPIPDDQNLAATPLIRSWFVRGPHGGPHWDDAWDAADLSKVQDPKPGNLRRPLDLAAWAWVLEAAASNRLANPLNPRRPTRLPDPAVLQSRFPSRADAARAILEIQKEDESRFDELREAARRPQARFPVDYNLENPWGILLPHLSGLRTTTRRLQVRACAELALGNSSAALQDVLLALRLGNSIQTEPFLISFLVRIAIIQETLQPVWEGLEDHRWTGEQLAQLQQELENLHFLPELDRAMASERAAALLTADLLAAHKAKLGDLGNVPGLSPGDESIRDFLERLAPRGWFDREKLNYSRLLDRQLDGAFDSGRNRVFPSRNASNSREIESILGISGAGRFGGPVSTSESTPGFGGLLQHRSLAAMLLPELKEIPTKATAVQTSVDQAWIACALERFRLVHGSFPESLAALVPSVVAALPTDPITGELYRYRRFAGGYQLYSVGWNERDDRGVPGPTAFDRETGDWVWREAP
ncbi:MAG: hypothetical protein U1G08_01130 [Verrucomicrobiota bacterium]